MLIDELQKRAAASAVLRKLAAGMAVRSLASMAAHPIRTGTAALGLTASAQKGRKTWHSMDPQAHAEMLGMDR